MILFKVLVNPVLGTPTPFTFFPPPSLHHTWTKQSRTFKNTEYLVQLCWPVCVASLGQCHAETFPEADTWMRINNFANLRDGGPHWLILLVIKDLKKGALSIIQAKGANVQASSAPPPLLQPSGLEIPENWVEKHQSTVFLGSLHITKWPLCSLSHVPIPSHVTAWRRTSIAIVIWIAGHHSTPMQVGRQDEGLRL